MSLLSSVVSENVQVSPLNVTVLKGSDVQFNATVQGKWMLMTWHVGSDLVLVFSNNSTLESASDQFSAMLCSWENTTYVAFTIRNVTRKEAGEITCSVLGFPGSNTAHLYVQGEVSKLDFFPSEIVLFFIKRRF